MLLGLHLFVPTIKLDAASIALTILILLPWLAPILRAIEVPGMKVEFKDLKQAGDKVAQAGLLSARQTDQTMKQDLFYYDPNLALANLRIEIERRLRRITKRHDVSPFLPQGIDQYVRLLQERELLTTAEGKALSDLIHFLNGAVHGAEVDPPAVQWAIEVGPDLLATLDERAMS